MLCFKRISQNSLKMKDKQRETIKNSLHNQNNADIKCKMFCNLLEENPGNLNMIADYVKNNRGAKIHLPFPEDITIQVCELDDTIYSGEKYMLDSWQELYLPKPTKMNIFGTVMNSDTVPFPPCIVLIAEDGHVYGYEDEKLYLLADSLKNFLKDGIRNTDTCYEYPHNISDEEEEVLQRNEEIRKMRERTRQFIDKDADVFNQFLESL